MATLNAMELMPASRSTLHESISRCAPLAVEEVSRDLGAVGWRECPVASVRRVGPPGAEAVEDAVPISAAAPPTAVKKVRKKRKRGGSLPLLAMAPPSCEASSC
uniref:Uncharacterized protein n=2 Tax=Anthurium amnicola TaxID=1678845 RepID=A0A1D1ZE44_9ARAE